MMDDTTHNKRRPGSALAGVAVLMAAALVLFGCPEDFDEDQIDADPAGEEDIDLDFELDDGFGDDETYTRPVYDGRRNPFRPDDDLVDVDDDAEDEIDDTGPTDPLEQYDLDSLELVTIVSQKAVPRAMFVAPGGMGHFATEGDNIGRDGGIIEDIRSNEVDIREGAGEAAATITVELREREIRQPTAEDELTEEERRALQELLDERDEEEALDERADREAEADDRLPGLRPPGEE